MSASTLVGVPRETKDHEYRVGLTPRGVHAIRAVAQHVRVQSGAGACVGFSDADYKAAGAEIVADARSVYAADLIVKVKEIQPDEIPLLHAGQVVFCYHHFAADPALLGAMLDARVSCVAYETVTAPDGSLPLLVPMSEIAGRLAPQVGAWALQMPNGGSGVLLAGAEGAVAARVAIIGAGTVGRNAARIALGMGADVTVLARDPARVARIENPDPKRLQVVVSSKGAIRETLAASDLVIGAVLQAGRLAPKLIVREDLAAMRPGSVLVDVAIDQGGIAETSRPTSHSEPLYVEEGVVHYCVPNMPSAVARTATLALTQATLPFVLALTALGLARAIRDDPRLAPALQVHAGRVTHRELAADTAHDYSGAYA